MKRKPQLIILFCLVLCYPFLKNQVLLSMSERAVLEKLKVYEHNGTKYVRDLIIWNGYCWSRHTSTMKKGAVNITLDNIITGIGDPREDLPKIYEENYERKDLIEYDSGINTLTGKRVNDIYRRRKSEDVIVTDKVLDRPYIRLGTFTIGGKTPANWKKVKKQIKAIAAGSFGADAVIVEKGEVLPFRKEDYFPITEFQYPEYVKYHCIAVAFEETAKIPEHLIYKNNE